jgi:hypothetical protein
MTATLSAQAELDQLDARRAELIAQASREAAISALGELRAACELMIKDLYDNNIPAARAIYDGSTDGMFYGPITRVKKAMGKLK